MHEPCRAPELDHENVHASINAVNERLQQEVGEPPCSYSASFCLLNLLKVHGTIRSTPAMASGLTDHAWDLSEAICVTNARVSTTWLVGFDPRRANCSGVSFDTNRLPIGMWSRLEAVGRSSVSRRRFGAVHGMRYAVAERMRQRSGPLISTSVQSGRQADALPPHR
jgi:hypothetical protein